MAGGASQPPHSAQVLHRPEHYSDGSQVLEDRAGLVLSQTNQAASRAGGNGGVGRAARQKDEGIYGRYCRWRSCADGAMPQNVPVTKELDMIRRAFTIFRNRGVLVLARAAFMRVCGMMASRAKSFQAYDHLFWGKSGIEIGGPSAVFARGGIFPVYSLVGNLDNVNFSNATAWNADKPNSGPSFQYDKASDAGIQYIGEATSLEALATGAYDFVLSSHMLEHTANPIKALIEWKRLLKRQGVLVLIVPNKKFTFDHRRPVTTIEHLIADFEAGVEEDDLTHLSEILALHDFRREPDASNRESLNLRGMRNFENRCLHHHVFDEQLAKELVEYVGLAVHMIEKIAPHHIVLLAQKT